ncbi:MAG TPA: DUF4350 domain-containing protein [Candidatus Sulfotelmatobacter sp.]|jgi:hypothetical protein|nr:DUF4350 domain-containing protein [Candidatus Sulfotelmatobacter sp.]
MKKYFPIVILLGCTAAFVFGILQLFEMRFAAGDVYPPYSSLRADPLGTMAFYESLGKLPGMSVSRDFSEANRLPEEPHTAYLHLAADNYEWEYVPDDLIHELKNFLARGGRLVITYSPQTTTAHPDFDEEDQTNLTSLAPPKLKEKKDGSGKPKNHKIKSGEEKSWVNLEEEWGFHECFVALEPDGDEYAPATVTNRTIPELPPELDWHSGMIFTNCAAGWRTIYARGTNAVVIERTFGKGSVVIASDSYFLSNEAMSTDRHADLLAWLVGDKTNVVFDEAHLGIVDTSGVAALMRKYRLHGLAAGLLLLAGLFIWKNSTSLVPPHAGEKTDDFVAGKDSHAGFVNLLRRSIPPRKILETCFAEWKKSVAPSGKLSTVRLQRAEAIFNADHSAGLTDHDPVETYKKISEALGNQNQKL